MFSFPPFLGLVLALAWHVRCDELISDYTGYNNAEYGVFPRLKFKSVDIDSPQLEVNRWNKEAMSKTGSHIFLRHDGHHENGGPQDSAAMILSADDLSLVYLNRSFEAVFDVRAQQNFGKNYLTFYGGPMTSVGLGDGYAHAYDEEYNEIYRIAPQNLTVKGDLHECQFTGNGTAMVTAYEVKPWNLEPWGGPYFATLVDSVFQEVELETNRVIFEWRASDHVDMAGSYEQVSGRWDYFHLNSIEKTQEGNYLLCARHMHSIYMINGTTGEVMWTLGGKANDFVELQAFGDNSTREASNPVLTMAWQHHARFFRGNENEITFFDNHVLAVNGFGCTDDCSRGLHIALDTESEPKTVRILNEYLHPVGLQSQSQGSVQPLDNGNVFVGWGRNPSFTEHTEDGETILDVQFSPWRSTATNGDGLDNYRTFKMDWKATPHWPPAIMIETSAMYGGSTAYVSWNGATEVKYWAILSSNSPFNLTGAEKVIAKVPRGGFETAIPIGTVDSRYLRAAALDVHKKIIGSTGIWDMETSDVQTTNYTIQDVGSMTLSDLEKTEASVESLHKVVLGWQIALACILALCVVLAGALFIKLARQSDSAAWWKVGPLQGKKERWMAVPNDDRHNGKHLADEDFDHDELHGETVPMKSEFANLDKV